VFHASLDGYCSTVQGLLDWFQVDLRVPELVLFRLIFCTVCVCVEIWPHVSCMSVSLLIPETSSHVCITSHPITSSHVPKEDEVVMYMWRMKLSCCRALDVSCFMFHTCTTTYTYVCKYIYTHTCMHVCIHTRTCMHV